MITLISCYTKPSQLVDRQRSETEVGLDGTEFREEGLGLFVADRRVYNDILAGNPVDRSSDTMFITGLEGVHHTEDLGGVTTGRGRVGQDEADGLLGIDDKDGPDGESHSLGVHVGRVLVVKHVICVGNLAGSVTNDGEGKTGLGDLINVINPSVMGLDGVRRKTNHLDVALRELGLKLREGTQLSGANGGEVVWVGKEHNPRIAGPLVELDDALGGFGLEVGSSASETEPTRRTPTSASRRHAGARQHSRSGAFLSHCGNCVCL